ncbi:MAG: CRISPR-associated endonuclease Cas1 [Bacteroidetes bacterium]|nr:CRISPR-associated endonuclease Cas1 [Bacteroidota bacterium]
MPTLYITEPGATIRFSSGSIVVTVSKDPDGSGPLPTKTQQLIEVEPHRIELIAIVGRIHITGHAVRFCLENGIPVSWFKRNGDYLGRMVPELSRTADIRLAQYSTATDANQSLALAKEFVSGKIHNSIHVLSSIRSNRPSHPELGSSLNRLKSLHDAVSDVTDLSSLLGYEGTAARTYFSGLKVGFDGEIPFNGREKRPPPDPSNALLSLGYVILTNWLASTIESHNLDPYLGFMHQRRSGRPSLALDLLEELRAPVVDRFVLRMCNRRQLRMEHFENDSEDRGVRLTRSGLRIFFRAWESMLDKPIAGIRTEDSLESMIRYQVSLLSNHLRHKEKYRSLRLGQASTH